MASTLDPNTVNAEEFAALVKDAGDEEILETVRGAGTTAVLDRVFAVMKERFLPDRAQGVDTTIQFVLSDEEQHTYWLRVANGTCETGSGEADDPAVTIATDVVSYLKIVSGQAQGAALFMAGKLRVQGDVMLAQRVLMFFDTPKA